MGFRKRNFIVLIVFKLFNALIKDSGRCFANLIGYDCLYLAFNACFGLVDHTTFIIFAKVFEMIIKLSVPHPVCNFTLLHFLLFWQLLGRRWIMLLLTHTQIELQAQVRWQQRRQLVYAQVVDNDWEVYDAQVFVRNYVLYCVLILLLGIVVY